MSQPRWDDLQLLLVVVRSGSALAASEELGLSQSTVSRRVAALEEQLGVRLFDRRGRRLEATSEAHALAQLSEQFDEDVGAAMRRVRSRARDLTGQVRISSVKPLLRLLLSRLHVLSVQHPQIELVLDTRSSLSNLHKKEADIVMRATSTPPETLVGRRIAKFAYGLYRPVGAAPSSRLVGYPPPRGDVGKASWLPEVVPNAKVALRIDDDELQQDAVRAGMGNAQLLCMAADADPTLERVPGAPLEWGEDLWVLTHPDLREMPRVRTVMDVLVDELSAQSDLIEGRRPLPRA